MSEAPETAAEKLVAQALFGNQQIKGEPDNYFVHRDTFLATVEQAIKAERERCAGIVSAARFGERDGDLRSLISAIRNPES